MNDSDKSAYPFQCHRCRSSSNPLVIYVLLASLYLAFVGHLYISCAWSGEVNNRLDHFSTRLEKFVSKLHRLAELQSAPDSSRKSRTKRFAPERDHWQSIFRWVDEENEENVSPNNRDRRAMTSQESENSAGQVDFFMQPQATDKQHPNFTWLTSYSRVPLSVLEEYCKSVQSHCLRGSPGPPGLQGIKGDRGYPGPPGDIGPVGPLGPKGNKDGLDGLEGPPGLDGSPGMDGLPGRKGESGVNGIPGRNGTDGKPGQKGEPGENGIPGIPGPKGKRGPPGAEGKPGITMTAWVHNDSLLLIAPSIDHANSTAQTITVKENEHFRLSCSASGQPSPTITWRREDGNPILRDGASYNAIESNQVNFSRISRDNMGSYLCVATNGVPPAATKLVNLLVTYPPLVKILLPKQMIGARMRSWAVLECYIEAYPEPFVDWIHGESRVLIDSDKYVRSEEPLEQRLSHVVSRRVLLNITYIESRDFGLYKCEARNHRGRTFGIITLYESDSKTVVDEKTLKESSFVLYGEIPKPVESKIKCEPCPECSPHLVSGGRGNQCQAGQRAAIVDLGSPEMQHRASWKLGQAAVECHLSQIGKPIFNGDYDNELGCWMRDPKPIRPGDENRYWLTRINLNDLLEQFENIDSFRNKQVERNYTLLHRFWGNAQTIYAGSFYYAKENTEKLIIFNLETSESAFINLEPRHHHPGRVKLPRKLLRHTRSQQHQERLSRARHEVINVEHKSLYTTQVNNTMDISADENGLWVVYPNIYSEMNSTIVVKFNGTIIDYVWNLTVDYHQLGDTFIMCGVLYGIESVNKLNTHISFAYNLYKQVELKHLEQIEFTNPFESTQYVGYNSRYQKLYTWDKGNILEYALKIDTNVAKLSKE